MTAVLAQGLRKTYGDQAALDGIDLDVPRGTVCGLLGPNGAGKTTTVRILTTLLRATGGRAEVAGFDVTTQPRQVRRHIGLVGQHAAVDELLTGRQNLELFGRLYHLSAAEARSRASELLEQFGLRHEGPAKEYSGGMRRRLDLAAGMILAPPVLFLDEPTTGLDPRSRAEIWRTVRELVAGGTTVLLTTQYLEEADQLADRISVIDTGRVVAEGTPDELKSKLGGDRLDLVVHDPAHLARAAEIIGRAASGPAEIDRDTRHVSAPVSERVQALTGVLTALAAAGIEVEDVAVRRPTLDEVFLNLTDTAGGTR
ncbi:Methionine ABC transporter ATP-binding protein [[Actinomadura] parvosata subsp. kistnae]|uniref:Daunorubicin/doxorubicin resistance ABC transporter ATP-binding protein DrrA n=1 Tax=[Actinomadura] parvosata subsp. kistnae TaxID=1909395 RepID=A0A1V0AL15_9ACTN|nr:ATP-binding cassette domain-containing protein [Nonomuraea sp. ATCC 55076]AQZ70915.1 daunorubicin/doxorubicin resistance ABC transporter ATP-binding protein DrrA [Nonomuraea sp. ATCC 55076]SPL97606.1 Methionine ABC transporter ATP-binding protein [Actinomadura parvosata subsp. kistnae]